MKFIDKVKIFERDKGWHYVSVLPMGDGTHFIALPAKVRSKEKLSLVAEVEISFETRVR